jgi:hypothetical protein
MRRRIALLVVLGACTAYTGADAPQAPDASADDAGSDRLAPSDDAAVADALPDVAEDGLDAGSDGPRRLVFVTTTTYSGALGSLAALDTACSLESPARSAKVWLSTSTVDAFGRIADVGPWYNGSGSVVFMNKAEIASGATQRSEMTYANGTPIKEATGFWTGSTNAGLRTAFNCQGWASNVPTDNGTVGDPANPLVNQWSNWSPGSCGQVHGLICFEQ